jgi:redox-sensitive bicupin YhaK (pirin superfamily)
MYKYPRCFVLNSNSIIQKPFHQSYRISTLILASNQTTNQQNKLASASTLKNLTRTISRNMSTKPPTMKVTAWPSSERGHANHGWLYSFHTFSFASWFSPKHNGIGPLRVINEDRVEKGTGFGTHSHSEFLIWSYIVSGELEHKDSMGNLETLKRGDVQFTSAGTGIRHSEYNRNNVKDNHFLQIWAKPDVSRLTPSYITRNYSDEEKRDALVKVIESTSRNAGGEKENDPIPAHSDVDMYASILTPGKTVSYKALGTDRKLYLHLVMTDKVQPATGGARIKIGDVTIGEGDGVLVEQPASEIVIESVGEKDAEFVFFDLGKSGAF